MDKIQEMINNLRKEVIVMPEVTNAAPVAPVTPVEGSLRYLGNQVSRLEELTSMFPDKLAIVLGSESDTKSPESRDTSCNLCNTLENYAHRMALACQTLNDLYDRVEL